MKIPLLSLGQSHFKCSCLFPRSSEGTNVVSCLRLSYQLLISGYCGFVKSCLWVELRVDNPVPFFQISSYMKFIVLSRL